jgi:hypothetical protein
MNQTTTAPEQSGAPQQVWETVGPVPLELAKKLREAEAKKMTAEKMFTAAMNAYSFAMLEQDDVWIEIHKALGNRPEDFEACRVEVATGLLKVVRKCTDGKSPVAQE